MRVNKRQWLLLGIVALVATVIDLYVINYTNLGGWVYILLGWFAAWVATFIILKRQWLYSTAAVLILSVVEDVCFLLWDRIAGRIAWGSQWYCHDWMFGISQSWGGFPSHYAYSLIIAGFLIWLGYHSRMKEVIAVEHR